MSEQPVISLPQAVEAIKTAILQGQYEAFKKVLIHDLTTDAFSDIYAQTIAYGISDQLRRDLPGLRGYSATNLKYMRLFYEAWQMLDTDSAVATAVSAIQESSVATDAFPSTNSSVATDALQIADNKIDIYHTIAIPNAIEFPVEDFFAVPFSHHVEIYQRTKDLHARYYYIHRTAEEHLSVDALEKLIKQQAYEHREMMPNNFAQTLSSSALARKAVMMFKDAYQLDFINTEEIGLRDKIDVDERVVEKEIVQNVKNFIMTFGSDFSFIGNQYHLEVYAHDFFPDLLFYNRELNALVVVELKTGEFNPSYLGQLTTYLRILDDYVRKPHENPSIGIVLCKSADKKFVEYVIQDYQKPMGVATYTTAEEMPEQLRKALPDMDELKRVLAGER